MQTRADKLWALFSGGIALVAQYLPAVIGLPIGIVAALFALWKLGILWPVNRLQLKHGANKMIITLGILLVIGGIIGIALLRSQFDWSSAQNGKPALVSPTSKSVSPVDTSKPDTVVESQERYHPFDFPNLLDASQIDPNKRVDIVIGTNNMIYKWSDFQSGGSPMTPMSLNGLIPFTPHTFGGKLYLDVQVYGSTDSPVITIKDNIATVLPPNWDKNHDDYAYEVINEKGQPIFQLVYNSQFSISIDGIFPFNGGYVIADNSGMIINPSPFTTLKLSPIFKYPSKEFQGVRR